MNVNDDSTTPAGAPLTGAAPLNSRKFRWTFVTGHRNVGAGVVVRPDDPPVAPVLDQ